MTDAIQISSEKTVNINRFFKFLFFCGGIYRTSQHQKCGTQHSLWFTGLTFFVVLGNAVGLSNRPLPADKVEILLFPSNIIAFTVLHWSIRGHRDSLMEFALRIRQKSFQCLGETEAAVLQTERLLTDTLKKLLPSLYVLFAGALFSALVRSFFGKVDFSDSKAYLIPFWYLCADSGENNFPIKFLCWRIDSYPKYIFTNSLAIFVISVVHLPVIGAVGFHIIVQTYLKTQFCEIKKRILALSAKMEVNSFDNRDALTCVLEKHYDNILLEELKDIIRHYQHTRYVVKGGLSYMCYSVSGILAGFYFNLLFCSFLIMKQPTSVSNVSFIFKSGSVLLASLVIFISIVIGAEVMKDWDQSIASILYSTPWHQQSTAFKKLTAQFSLLLSKPLEIRAFGTYKIGFVFLMTMLRNLYSALNLMLATWADN